VASVRGNPEIKTPLQYVRTDPDVIPKVTLTGDTTQRTDTRVLQVIYKSRTKRRPAQTGAKGRTILTRLRARTLLLSRHAQVGTPGLFAH